MQNQIIEGYARAKTQLRELERDSELQRNRRSFSFKRSSLRNLRSRLKRKDRTTAVARRTVKTA